MNFPRPRDRDDRRADDSRAAIRWLASSRAFVRRRSIGINVDPVDSSAVDTTNSRREDVNQKPPPHVGHSFFFFFFFRDAISRRIRTPWSKGLAEGSVAAVPSRFVLSLSHFLLSLSRTFTRTHCLSATFFLLFQSISSSRPERLLFVSCRSHTCTRTLALYLDSRDRIYPVGNKFLRESFPKNAYIDLPSRIYITIETRPFLKDLRVPIRKRNALCKPIPTPRLLSHVFFFFFFYLARQKDLSCVRKERDRKNPDISRKVKRTGDSVRLKAQNPCRPRYTQFCAENRE